MAMHTDQCFATSSILFAQIGDCLDRNPDESFRDAVLPAVRSLTAVLGEIADAPDDASFNDAVRRFSELCASDDVQRAWRIVDACTPRLLN